MRKYFSFYTMIIQAGMWLGDKSFIIFCKAVCLLGVHNCASYLVSKSVAGSVISTMLAESFLVIPLSLKLIKKLLC